ncbi:MAG: hypothetical protein ABI759_24555 [Candidatus Solibacter sp.]
MTKELFVCDPHTTNNLMELMAAFQGTRGHGAVQVSGVNYFFGLTTTISPDQRQLLLAA